MGASADCQGGGDVERVGAHQHDVCGFDGDVGTGADGDTDVGLSQGGRVVDAFCLRPTCSRLSLTSSTRPLAIGVAGHQSFPIVHIKPTIPP
jgi:hypothetical protein